jgi:1-acyl-sn-glycerol-3-phosphate acyltransferase
MRSIKGVYFWVMAFTVTFCLYLACLVAHIQVVAFGRPRDGRPVHRMALLWGRLLIRLMPGWQVEVQGREHLPPDHVPMVMVGNHESFADIWAMCSLDVQFRWLSKDSIFKIPMIGHAMRWANYVSVERGRKNSTMLAMQTSAERLRQGLSMFYFPEGTRSVDGQLRPFKLGAFKLARDEHVPVLPIAIHGAAELLPKHSWLPGKARVAITILPPLPPPAATDDLDAYAGMVRGQIAAVHSQMV